MHCYDYSDLMNLYSLMRRHHILQGAKVQTYLLEKVRIGYHASGERNYHIFYQLLSGGVDKTLFGNFSY